jgi:PHP family Zn ribbon phosphoesterase
VNPLGASVYPSLGRFHWAAVISFRTSFTLGEANSFTVGNINCGKKLKIL